MVLLGVDGESIHLVTSAMFSFCGLQGAQLAGASTINKDRISTIHSVVSTTGT